jgi:hypothetical protein
VKKLEPIYIERNIDQELARLESWWLKSPQRVRLTRVVSAPGWGNTSLLRNLRGRFLKAGAFKDALVLFVNSEGSVTRSGQYLTDPLRPLARELRKALHDSRGNRLRQIRRRFREAGPLRLVKVAALVTACFAFSSLLNGFSVYLSEIDLHFSDAGPQILNFFLIYLPSKWHNFPGWFVTSSFASLPLSFAALYMTRNRLIPEPPPPSLTEEELQIYQSEEGLLRTVGEITRDRRGLVLLIDNLPVLPYQEKLFLNTLLFSTDRSLPRWHRSLRFLVVAVDWYQEDESEPNGQKKRHVPSLKDIFPDAVDDKVQQLTVAPFDPIALHTIFHSLVSGADRAGYDEEELIEEAEGSVKPVLLLRERSLALKLGEEIDQAKGVGSFFRLFEMMTYQAVRQAPFVRKKDLLSWLTSNELHDHRILFDQLAPHPSENLVEHFTATSLVRVVGDACYFDRSHSLALVELQEKNNPALVAEACYFWFVDELRKLHVRLDPTNVSQLSALDVQSIRIASRMARHIKEVLEAPTNFLADAPGISPDEKAHRHREIGYLLLTAAALWRRDADLAESVELVEEALWWLRSLNFDDDGLFCEAAADQLWRSYWLSGDRKLRERILALETEFPRLVGTLSYCTHRRFEDLLQCEPSAVSKLSEAELRDPLLLDMYRLETTLRAIHDSHGLLQQGLADPTITVGEPVAALLDPEPEHHLRWLQAAAHRHRGEATSLRDVLRLWRERLLEGEGSDSPLGQKAQVILGRARFQHALIAAAGEGLGDLETLCLTSPPSLSLEQHLFRGAREDYEQTLRMSGLLHWLPLTLWATYGLACLTQDYAPSDLRSSDGWQDRWDELFRRCLEIEVELGWKLPQPWIHFARFRFFQEISVEHAANDAYNLLQSIRAAKYPSRVVLAWHRIVRTLLNNYPTGKEDWKLSGYLQEEWAQNLMDLPEARPLWDYPDPDQERASTLIFAAQAMRSANELDQADRLLNDAEKILRTEQDRTEANQMLHIDLLLQRAWLRKAQQREALYRSLIHEIWRALRPTDKQAILVLGSLVDTEDREGQLTTSWPRSAALPAERDPENESLSLPSDHPLLSMTLTGYDFRLCQFLFLLQPQSGQTNGVAIQSSEHCQTLFHLAEVGLRISLRPQIRRRVLSTLLSAYSYLKEIEKVQSKVLETLRFLMHYADNPSDYRSDYVAVLREQEALLRHELLTHLAAQQWLGLAERMNSYFGVLVDQPVWQQVLIGVIRDMKWTPEQFNTVHEARRQALQQAFSLFHAGDIKACLHQIEPVLPQEQEPWVLLEDLRALDLWLQCQVQHPAASHEEIGKRTSQLQQLSLRFVRQLGTTTRESDIQHLVLKLLARP